MKPLGVSEDISLVASPTPKPKYTCYKISVVLVTLASVCAVFFVVFEHPFKAEERKDAVVGPADGGAVPATLAPTGSPTTAPTAAPTTAPTMAPTVAPPVDVDPCAYTTSWLDDFSSPASLSDNWNVVDLEQSHNNELQFYTSREENVKVEDGMLVITPRLESFGSKQWTSGRMNGAGKRSFLFGKVTIRAKLPKGKGLWSALWMLPEEDHYGTWAASGEIDIMEGDGSVPDKTSSALHFSDVWPYNTHVSSGLLDPAVCEGGEAPSDFSDGLHDFQLFWDAGKMTFAVDGTVHWEQDLQRDWCARALRARNRPGAPPL
jgi:hypothetical protein